MIDPTTLRRQRHDLQRRELAVLEAAAAARRAEEREERHAAPLCAVCGGELPPPSGRRRSSVCPSCHAEGYVPAPCKGCGGKLKRIDQTGPNDPEKRGYCATCREGMAAGAARCRAAGLCSAEIRAARPAAANEMSRLCIGLVPVPGRAGYLRPCPAIVDQPLGRCAACGAQHQPEVAA